MEYRMKYRDIPWSVAFGVFFGKLYWTFIVRPPMWFKSVRWGYLARKTFWKCMKFMLWFLIALVICIVIFLVLNETLNGDVAAWLQHITGLPFPADLLPDVKAPSEL